MGKSSKKSKKHSKKRGSSSSEDEWVEADTLIKPARDLSDSSPEELIKKKKSRRHRSPSSSSSSDHTERKRKQSKRNHRREKTHKGQDFFEPGPEKQNIDNVRDDWMNLPTNFSSFSNVDRKKSKEEERKNQKEKEVYDPSKCPKELNVYWKNGGDGLPKFQKPTDESRHDKYSYKRDCNIPSGSGQSRWRKSKPMEPPTILSNEPSASHSKPDSHAGRDSAASKPITEKELNLLAGKLVKAEIMGNKKLVEELKQKLEAGRRALAEEGIQDEEVILTQSTRQGPSKPLELTHRAESSGKQRRKPIETHLGNERVKYFPDDDKYSLKEMFENEKFSSANDQDAEFMKIASNVKKNDDLDDLFTDDVRRKKSDSKVAEAMRSKAISEHKKVTSSLDNCLRCIQSTAMQKHLIVSMGEFVYLALPAHEPLVKGHCFIAPIRHAASVTQLDENEWNEMNDFRKALMRMFGAQRQEAVFFEIAVGFHRYPHTALECIPLDTEEATTAPMYFKKAIDESETEWAQNKKLVPLKGRGVRQVIPKELPYFAVNFGTSEGFAHVIEDDKLFPKNFAQEIIGGMLDLDHGLWRKPLRQSFEVQSKRTVTFSNEWKDFDCTAKAL